MHDQGSSSCSYRFICSSLTQLPASREYDVVIRQQPERSKMSVINERDRRPIEPPPILQMKWLHCSSEDTKKCLQSPFYFLVANIVDAENNQLLLPAQDYLSGTTVSSLHRLRDIDNQDGGFYVFGDLSVKKNGLFKLQFSLFEIVEGTVQNRKTLLSNPFTVYLPKHFPGPLDATFLSRTFSDQGVKMRIRKEHRLQTTTPTTRKRKTDQQQRSDSNGSNHSTLTTGSTTKAPPPSATERASKRKIVPPSYAPSSSQDVHFGRFLSSERSPHQPVTTAIYNKNDHYYTHPYHQPLDGNNPPIPPPQPKSSDVRSVEPASYHNHQRHPHHQQDQHQAMVYPSPQSSSDLLPCTTSHHGRLSPSPGSYVASTPPSPSYAQYYSSSPPTLSMDHHHLHPLPITHSLASYHLSSPSLSSSSYQHNEPPPPPMDTSSSPPPMPDHLWGFKLPPLRAIMTEDSAAVSDPVSIFPTRSFCQLPPIQSQPLSTSTILPIYP
ncbi:velvet factor-domain-containing protein [Absidia repens]|uniref:Velvet factor-domain-containing protein n=1 Tax=Absidia repens TaxID=90262 RepID=A0A1X2IEW6_9FUNG|nr:velvet factor-domain-containing protein [Absidia repens]